MSFECKKVGKQRRSGALKDTTIYGSPARMHKENSSLSPQAISVMGLDMVWITAHLALSRS